MVKKLHNAGPLLDQGDRGYCTSFSFTTYLIAAAQLAGIRRIDATRYARRHFEMQMSEHPRNPYSISAVLGVGLNQGLITSYVELHDVDEIKRHVLHTGPLLLYTGWTNSMKHTQSRSGIVRVKRWQETDSAHALVITGFNSNYLDQGPAFRLRSSNGPYWGKVINANLDTNGNGWLQKDDLDWILNDAPVEFTAGVANVFHAEVGPPEFIRETISTNYRVEI